MFPPNFLHAKSNIGAASKYLAERLTQILKKHAPVYQLRAPEEADYHPNPGEFRESLKPRVELTSQGVKIQVVSGAPHAPFVVFDTSEHPIVAKNARILRWWAEGGNVHFATQVDHPGTSTGTKFREKYQDETRQEIRRQVLVAIRTGLKS